ncbi:hypothetical protein TNCV_4523671 [Trichonephila clavipes]|nr:hypothetical protein TNCV_4523671 [Trichonephila clavipes]
MATGSYMTPIYSSFSNVRFGGLSEERPETSLYFYRPNVLARDERQRRPLVQPVKNPRPVVWKHDTLPLDPIR